MPKVAAFLLVCAVLLSVSFVAADAATDFITVNGVAVSQDDYVGRLENVKVQITDKTGKKVSVPAGQYTVQQMISEMLLTQLAEKEHVTPTPEQIDAKVAFTNRSKDGNMDAILKAQGITEQEWRRQIGLQQAMINLITKGVTVSDVEARADYDLQVKSGTSPFKKAEAYNFSVVTCQEKSKIDKAYKELEAGKAFEEVAKQYSEDPSTAPDGGKVGWLSADMTAAPEIIRLTTFGTPVGKYSKPVFFTDKQDKGWVIIKVNEKRPEEVQSFDQVKDLVKEQIAVKKADRKAFEKMLADFVASSTINVSADRFKDIPDKVRSDISIPAGVTQPAVAPAPGK